MGKLERKLLEDRIKALEVKIKVIEGLLSRNIDDYPDELLKVYWSLDNQHIFTEILDYNEFTQYLPKKASVLDIGSGSDTTGMVRFLVSSSFEVTTFDRLAMEEDEMKYLYLDKFVKGDFFKDLQRFPSNKFDGITSILAIFVTEKEGMLEFKALFDSFHYILKPLGYFLITIGAYEYSDDKFIDIAEDSIHNLQNMIKSCGFHILKFSSFMDPDIDKNIRILAQRKS